MLFFCDFGAPDGPPNFSKNQHECDFERVQEGFEDTSHMKILLETAPGPVYSPQGGSGIDFLCFFHLFWEVTVGPIGQCLKVSRHILNGFGSCFHSV